MTAEHYKPIRVLVAGTGHGLRVLVPALRASAFEVVGLVGARAERTRAKADSNGISGAFTDLESAIQATQAQAVVIATPPHTHAALVRTAVAHGCHVLCEKPFARNAEEARDMLAAAERAGVVHLMGNQFRMMPPRALMRRAIADGLIGEPRMIAITQYAGLVADPEARRPAWWFDAAQGGGWLGASGSHMIDMVRTWLGEFASLSAALTVVADRQVDADDTYLLRFTMANGAEGVLMQTGAAWGKPAAMNRVAGTLGVLEMESDGVWLQDRHGRRRLDVPPELELEFQAPSDDPGKPFLHVELPPAKRLCEAWRTLIAGEPADTVPPATFADGLACMEVIDAIRASAANGGALVKLRRS